MSYSSADRPWAESIAWELEHAGHSVIVQAWDILPGANFVLQMDEASTVAERTIAVLSQVERHLAAARERVDADTTTHLARCSRPER